MHTTDGQYNALRFYTIYKTSELYSCIHGCWNFICTTVTAQSRVIQKCVVPLNWKLFVILALVSFPHDFIHYISNIHFMNNHQSSKQPVIRPSDNGKVQLSGFSNRRLNEVHFRLADLIGSSCVGHQRGAASVVYISSFGGRSDIFFLTR